MKPGLCAVEYRHQQCVRSPGHHGEHVWLMPVEEKGEINYYVLRLPNREDQVAYDLHKQKGLA